MYRKTMAPNAGMLFDFGAATYQTFWMKNTILPLDMIFIRADGMISSIAPNAVPYSETHDPVGRARPRRAGDQWRAAAALGIKAGQRVHAAIFGKLARPPLNRRVATV